MNTKEAIVKTDAIIITKEAIAKTDSIIVTKKRKVAPASDVDDTVSTTSSEGPALCCSLESIEEHIALLLKDYIPSMEETKALSSTTSKTNNDLEGWCRKALKLQRRFDLLTKLVDPALYKWTNDHTGNSRQNLDSLKAEIEKASDLLHEASGCTIGVLYPDLTTVRLKAVEEEEIVEGGDDDGGNEEYNGNESDVTTTSTAVVSTSSCASAAPLPSTLSTKKRKVTISHNTYENAVRDPNNMLLHRDLICDEAPYRRELMVAALSMSLKAFKDYRKAAANDVDSRNSGMMM